MEDRELVQDCLQGKVESYREVMNRYSAQAMAVAMNMLMNAQDAEDACQEAFLRAFRNLDRFDFERSFKNWFYAVLSNICLDHLRGRKRRTGLLQKYQREGGAAVVTDPAPDPPRRPGLDPKFLARLAPRERLCVYLWAQEDCSGPDIAAVLGCSPATANVYLHRARRKLKSAIQEGQHA